MTYRVHVLQERKGNAVGHPQQETWERRGVNLAAGDAIKALGKETSACILPHECARQWQGEGILSRFWQCEIISKICK